MFIFKWTAIFSTILGALIALVCLVRHNIIELYGEDAPISVLFPSLANKTVIDYQEVLPDTSIADTVTVDDTDTTMSSNDQLPAESTPSDGLKAKHFPFIVLGIGLLLAVLGFILPVTGYIENM